MVAGFSVLLCQLTIMHSRKRKNQVQEVEFLTGTTKRGKRRLLAIPIQASSPLAPRTPTQIRKLQTPASETPLPAPNFGTPNDNIQIQVPAPKPSRKPGLVSLHFFWDI
jgi:hypothetical protein